MLQRQRCGEVEARRTHLSRVRSTVLKSCWPAAGRVPEKGKKADVSRPDIWISVRSPPQTISCRRHSALCSERDTENQGLTIRVHCDLPAAADTTRDAPRHLSGACASKVLVKSFSEASAGERSVHQPMLPTLATPPWLTHERVSGCNFRAGGS